MQKLLLYITITLLFSALTMSAEDKTKPVVTVTTDGCGNYKVTITELNNGDVGVDSIPAPKWSNCFNVSNITLSPNFKANQPNFDFFFTFHVLNPLDSASMQFLVVDGAQNPEFTKIHYVPNLIDVSPNIYNFLAKVVDDTAFTTIRLVNDLQTTNIVDMKFRHGKYYSYKGPKSLTLLPNEEYNLEIKYCPKNEVVNGLVDADTLDIFTVCNNIKFRVYLSGYGVKPKIQVEDVDFGFVRIGEKIDLSKIKTSDSAITISNPGTDFLNISRYKLRDGRYFKISQPHEPELSGYTIYPKDSVHFKSIELYPDIPGRITDTLVISSNAKDGPDSIAILTAYSVYPGAYLTEYQFGDRRLLTNNSAYIYIRNNSDKSVKISGIKVSGDTNDIKVLYSEIIPLLDKNNPIDLYPENVDSTTYLTQIKIPVNFTPLTEYNKRIKITLVFAGDDTSSIETFNYVDGRGILPKVSAEGVAFEPEILSGTKYPGVKHIKITNTSSTSDLILYEIKPSFVGDFGEKFFSFPQPLPKNKVIAKGETLEVPVEFYPLTSGNMSLNVKITTNSNLYYPTEYKKDTLVRLTGSAYKTPVSIEHTILPKINQCSTGIITVTMTNISLLEPIKIDSIKIAAVDQKAFEFVDEEVKKGFTIAAGGNFDFDLLYNPSASNKSLDRVIIEYYALEHSYGFELFAECYTSNINVTLDTLYNLRPGVTINSGIAKQNSFLVKISSDNYTGTSADSFQLKLLYNPGQIQFLDKVLTAGGMNDWVVSTKSANIGTEETELSIFGHSSVPQTKFEGILYPVFETVLSDTNQIVIKAVDLILNDKSECFTKKLGIGKIYINGCALQMGRLVLSKYGFNMMAINPNPVNGDFVTIKFSVAFRALTTIEFYNTEGNLIYAPLNKYLEPGDYEMQFSVKDVPAGTYLVKYQSGFFNDSQQIIIIK